MSFVHLCARFTSGLSYVIGFNTARTAAFIIGVISNAALFVLLLEFASFQQEGF
jgi:tetrahydromethanopterin S-methyltransferase subunit F